MVTHSLTRSSDNRYEMEYKEASDSKMLAAASTTTGSSGSHHLSKPTETSTVNNRFGKLVRLPARIRAEYHHTV